MQLFSYFAHIPHFVLRLLDNSLDLVTYIWNIALIKLLELIYQIMWKIARVRLDILGCRVNNAALGIRVLCRTDLLTPRVFRANVTTMLLLVIQTTEFARIANILRSVGVALCLS